MGTVYIKALVMTHNQLLILDRFCEVYDLLKPWMDFEFYDLNNHNITEGAIYLIGRKQFLDNVEKIKQYVDRCTIILSNPHEGSQTLKGLCLQLGIDDLVRSGKVLLIGGGNMESEYPYLQYESFLPKILDYEENIKAQTQSQEIFNKFNKPYKFLFLNGRIRSHRKYLLEHFKSLGLLDQSLWSNLDSNPAAGKTLNHPNMHTPSVTRSLPTEYEVIRYQNSTIETENHYKKYQLFNNEWGEIFLEPSAYIDTYFSLVTETVFEYPYSFRTEKIWKPVAMGHPFIAVANQGYYRDLQNLGFQTFGHVIDESFDSIEDNQQRIERIVEIVEDLCQQDLDSFLKECYTVCKYNQQHLAEMRFQVRREFPDRFFQFLREHNIE
jgi:hypothetical protein